MPGRPWPNTKARCTSYLLTTILLTSYLGGLVLVDLRVGQEHRRPLFHVHSCAPVRRVCKDLGIGDARIADAQPASGGRTVVVDLRLDEGQRRRQGRLVHAGALGGVVVVDLRIVDKDGGFPEQRKAAPAVGIEGAAVHDDVAALDAQASSGAKHRHSEVARVAIAGDLAAREAHLAAPDQDAGSTAAEHVVRVDVAASQVDHRGPFDGQSATAP
eukprot:scaffold37451_cov37-Phaeocystis_antarctica.AAC.2